MAFNFTICRTTKELPLEWGDVIGQHNILLSQRYFSVLKDAEPENMECFFVAFYTGKSLIGGALIQYLSFSRHQSFQKDELLCDVKNFLAKKISRDVMFVGNNMLTGQNAFYFDKTKITMSEAAALLNLAVEDLQKTFKKTSLVIYKDFQKDFINSFKGTDHKKYLKFSVQPNMQLVLRPNWNSFEDYLSDFSTKYRSRANTARKKAKDIYKKELSAQEIKSYEPKINTLYKNVAENAPFNTFFLPLHHFFKLKEALANDFRLFAYFIEDEMVGFYTLILNGKDIDTYFLGYDKEIQKEKQIYLNMLLDMVKFGIDEKFSRIIFGRTALEIKSTIGAEPVEIFGLIKHNNILINPFMEKIFPSLSPSPEWIQRKPFK